MLKPLPLALAALLGVSNLVFAQDKPARPKPEDTEA